MKTGIFRRLGALLLAVAVAIAPVSAPTAISAEEMVTIDFRDVDISEFVKTMSKMLKRNFLLDQGVRGTVTILGPKPVPVSEMWRIFHSVLAVKGLTVVKSGQLYKIVQRKGAKQFPIPIIVGRKVNEISEEPVIQIVPMEYSSANDAKNFLTNFISQNGELLVHDPTNSLIIVDQRDYVARLLTLLGHLDSAAAEEIIEMISIQHMAVDTAIKLINDILKPAAAGAGAAGAAPSPAIARRRGKSAATGSGTSSPSGARMIPDTRLNRLIVIGTQSDIDEIKDLLLKLDIEEEGAQQKVHVYQLQHADAEELAATLNSIGSTKSQAAAKEGAAAKPSNVKIVADKQNNSIIFIADDAEELKSLLKLLEQLDVPKSQVYIQAAIVEVSISDTGNFALGVGIAGEQEIFNKDGIIGGGRSFDITQLANPGALFGSPGIAAGAIIQPAEGSDVPPIGAILQAVRSNSNINVLSTPHLLTSDNEEAEIVVGDNVPFLTGQTATSGGNVISSIDRRDVGITLRVTPQVNDSGMVRLQIYQEISSVSPDAPSGLDVNQQGLITRKRSAKTNVVVKEGQTVAIGGLIGTEETRSESKVPVLGDIPIIGWLFKSRTKQKRRTNLVIFLSPTIVRGATELNAASLELMEDVYGRVERYVNDEQREFFESKIDAAYAYVDDAESNFDRQMVIEIDEPAPATTTTTPAAVSAPVVVVPQAAATAAATPAASANAPAKPVTSDIAIANPSPSQPAVSPLAVEDHAPAGEGEGEAPPEPAPPAADAEATAESPKAAAPFGGDGELTAPPTAAIVEEDSLPPDKNDAVGGDERDASAGEDTP